MQIETNAEHDADRGHHPYGSRSGQPANRKALLDDDSRTEETYARDDALNYPRRITATRDTGASLRPPCRSRSRNPTLGARPESGREPSGKFAAPASPAAARRSYDDVVHHARFPTRDNVSGRH